MKFNSRKPVNSCRKIGYLLFFLHRMPWWTSRMLSLDTPAPIPPFPTNVFLPTALPHPPKFSTKRDTHTPNRLNAWKLFSISSPTRRNAYVFLSVPPFRTVSAYYSFCLLFPGPPPTPYLNLILFFPYTNHTKRLLLLLLSTHNTFQLQRAPPPHPHTQPFLALVCHLHARDQ